MHGVDKLVATGNIKEVRIKKSSLYILLDYVAENLASGLLNFLLVREYFVVSIMTVSEVRIYLCVHILTKIHA